MRSLLQVSWHPPTRFICADARQDEKDAWTANCATSKGSWAKNKAEAELHAVSHREGRLLDDPIEQMHVSSGIGEQFSVSGTT